MNIITSVLPVLVEGQEYNVTSPYGYRVDPVTGVGNGAHSGIDLVLWRHTWSDISDIGAAWDGVVVSVRDGVEGFSKTKSAGNYVVIDHGGGAVAKYFHLAVGTVSVSEGETVHAGQVIGRMGSTGYSTGAHLHFQIEIDGEPVDPLPFLLGERVLDTAPDGGTESDTDSTEGFDNTPAEWAADAVQWALNAGILYGDENGNLRLHEPCTREMMLVFLHRAIGGGA